MKLSENEAKEKFYKSKRQIESLKTQLPNIATINNIIYHNQSLRNMAVKHGEEWRKEDVMMMDAVSTTVVMAYGRLFTETEGVRKLNKKVIPRELLATHKEIMDLRNERYAHSGNHNSTESLLEIELLGSQVNLMPSFRFSGYNGAPDRWDTLFRWLQRHIKTSFKKTLDSLTKSTGKEWRCGDLDFKNEQIMSQLGLSIRAS